MASFDIIDSVGNAYRFLWVERRYIGRLILVPVIVKAACHLAVEVFEYEQNFIRQALIMLPSYFLDGWVVSHVTRFALFGQRWPYRDIGGRNAENPMQMLRDRMRAVLTGTVMFVLTRFIIMGLLGAVTMTVKKTEPNGHDVAPGLQPEAFMGALLFLFCGLWAFRLLWLYIPAAANVPVRVFLKKINGFAISFYMLGTWLVCFLPLILVFMLVISLIITPFGGIAATGMPPIVQIIVILGWVLADTAVEIVATFALALGTRSFLIEASQTEKGRP